MCPKKQFYHHKNVWTVSIVKFEFLGYNGLSPAAERRRFRHNQMQSPFARPATIRKRETKRTEANLQQRQRAIE